MHGAARGDCDLLDPAAVGRLLDRVSPDADVHAAGSFQTSALVPVGGYFNNVSSTLNLLRSALSLGVKRIVRQNDGRIGNSSPNPNFHYTP